MFATPALFNGPKQTIAMLKKKHAWFFVLPVLLLLGLILTFSSRPGDYAKLDDGIVVRLKKAAVNGAHLVKLQAVTDKIIHITASPLDSFPTQVSLMVEEKKRDPVKWDVKESDDTITLVTKYINARVSLTSGEVLFTDKTGRPVLQEQKMNGRSFVPVTVDGKPAYAVEQVFESPDDEAFYGLGQHQNGVMNYKGHQVDLTQNNTEIAIPFMVSSRNYGVLWDNYSITRVGDSRPYEPLSTLKLYAADGKSGSLTATYANKANPSDIFLQQQESIIDYEFLSSLKKWPTTVKMANSMVTWSGDIESVHTGLHHFLFRYGGYAKIWIGDKLLADRWRQPWNPGTAELEVDLVQGKKYPIKIEWNPDGGEAYLSLKWLSPLQGAAQRQWSIKSESGNAINYYFVYGNNMDDVIGGYRAITGAAPMVPKWAMGLWQSRERYRTQQEIESVTGEFRKRKIPLDNIVLDWSYWEEDKWGSQEFDLTRFPDAGGMIKTLHDKYNARFMISVWPKFYEGISNYKYFDDNGWLYKGNINNRQRDWIGKGYVSTFYDAFNPKAREAFWGLINKHLYVKGIDAWWLDSTEPDIHTNASIEERKELMMPGSMGSSTNYFNAYALQNAKGVYDGQRKTNPDKRVFILTRSAYAGLQRYGAATWSGDIGARWHDFKDQIAAGINFSLSGIPYWTTDIGGFAVEKRYERAQGKDLEEWRELMTRWYQFGAFCPLFRVHGQFPYREIFNVAPESHTAYQSMLYYDKLRYRLMPYIYSLAGKTNYDHYTIMRGLMMDFAADPAVKNIGDQYMFGPALLVNPVYDFNATQRKLYLPANTGWYDLYTGKYNSGGQFITAAAPLERMPVFVKEGSIIPFGPELQYTTEKPADTITLNVYTGKDGQFTLYEDEDTNYNYENGAAAKIPFQYNEQSGQLIIGAREGSFKGMLQERTFRINWMKKNKERKLNWDEPADVTIQYTGKKTIVKMR
jgi:alpha-D-xyloside xylohydrolase